MYRDEEHEDVVAAGVFSGGDFQPERKGANP